MQSFPGMRVVSGVIGFIVMLTLCVILPSEVLAQRSIGTIRTSWTVPRAREFCFHHADAQRVVWVRGFYTTDQFFGPRSFQTGYLFKHDVPALLDPGLIASGLLVDGPSIDSASPLPNSGRIEVRGRLSCGTAGAGLRLIKWKPSVDPKNASPYIGRRGGLHRYEHRY